MQLKRRVEKEIKLARNVSYASTLHQQNLTGVQNLALQEVKKLKMLLLKMKMKK